VHALIKREYERASAIAYMSQPTGGSHPGWGTIGTRFDFERKCHLSLFPICQVVHTKESLSAPQSSTLSAKSVSARSSGPRSTQAPDDESIWSVHHLILLVDSVGRALLPSLPPLKPQTRLLAHLRSLLIFVPVGPTSNALKTLDAVYALAKYTEASRELTEHEFAAGIEAAQLLRGVFERELEGLERGSTTGSQGGEVGGSAGAGAGASVSMSEGMEEPKLRRASSGHMGVKSYVEEGSFSVESAPS
jgi:hypothetical protein